MQQLNIDLSTRYFGWTSDYKLREAEGASELFSVFTLIEFSAVSPESTVRKTDELQQRPQRFLFLFLIRH